MVGLVISDTFLLTGNWQDDAEGSLTVSDVTQVQFTDPITSFLHNEAELNAILASSLRKAKEVNSFAGQDIVIGLPDSFVEHSIVKMEHDLSRDDHEEYIK